ncbi:MAG TPA: hypothetical protein PKG67_03005, partial [Turneriella sp.]|nr:hypothetical protein [Turneriella sp.]
MTGQELKAKANEIKSRFANAASFDEINKLDSEATALQNTIHAYLAQKAKQHQDDIQRQSELRSTHSGL